MTTTIPAPALPTLTDAAAALRAGETTATELMEQSIAAAQAADSEIGTYLTRFDDHARLMATRTDEPIAAGEPLGPLAGSPEGIKDILAYSKGPTTAQSLVLDPAWGAATGDCVVVRRLERAGAIVTGKTTTMEFAIGAPDPDKPFPVPRNA